MQSLIQSSKLWAATSLRWEMPTRKPASYPQRIGIYCFALFQTSANMFRLRMCELAGKTTKVYPSQTITDLPTSQFLKHRIG